MSARILPAFASEAEEADWWYQNREEHSTDFERAFNEGRTTSGSRAQELLAARRAATIMIAARDAETATLLAKKKGVEMQQYVADLLHSALQRELDSAA